MDIRGTITLEKRIAHELALAIISNPFSRTSKGSVKLAIRVALDYRIFPDLNEDYKKHGMFRKHRFWIKWTYMVLRSIERRSEI
jgi:hypothetical protein